MFKYVYMLLCVSGVLLRADCGYCVLTMSSIAFLSHSWINRVTPRFFLWRLCYLCLYIPIWLYLYVICFLLPCDAIPRTGNL